MWNSRRIFHVPEIFEIRVAEELAAACGVREQTNRHFAVPHRNFDPVEGIELASGYQPGRGWQPDREWLSKQALDAEQKNSTEERTSDYNEQPEIIINDGIYNQSK